MLQLRHRDHQTGERPLLAWVFFSLLVPVSAVTFWAFLTTGWLSVLQLAFFPLAVPWGARRHGVASFEAKVASLAAVTGGIGGLLAGVLGLVTGRLGPIHAVLVVVLAVSCAFALVSALRDLRSRNC